MKQLPYERFVLPNGLTVLLYPMESVYTSFAALYVRVGAAHEKKNERGLSHFTEHVGFQGTKDYPTHAELSRAEAAIGAYLNAYTDRRKTNYVVQVPYTELDGGLSLLHQIVFEPIVDKTQVERERETALVEFNDIWQRPENRFSINFWRKRFAEKEHPYSYMVLGSPETIQEFTKEDALRWRKRFYQPANMILSIAGKFDRKRIKDLLLEKFGQGKKSYAKKEPEFRKGRYSGLILFHHPEKRDQITFSISFPLFGWRQRRRKEEFKTLLLNRILGVGPASRLFERVREEEKLVYAIWSHLILYPWRGVLEIEGSVPVQKLFRALLVIREELDKLIKKGVSEKELSFAKKAYSAAILMRFDRPEDIAVYFASEEFDGLGIWLPEKYIAEINKITEKEANVLPREVFDYSRVNIGLFGDVSEEMLKETKRVFNISSTEK